MSPSAYRKKFPDFLTDPEFCGSQSQEHSRLVTGSRSVVEVSLTSHSEGYESEPGFSNRASVPVPSFESGHWDQERLEADL